MRDFGRSDVALWIGCGLIVASWLGLRAAGLFMAALALLVALRESRESTKQEPPNAKG